MGGMIGSVIGAIPGLHGVVADWLAYINAKRVYPKSRIAGVIGPEGANNSVHAASFVPTVIFGIPGTPFAAVILSLFAMLHFDLGSSCARGLFHHVGGVKASGLWSMGRKLCARGI